VRTREQQIKRNESKRMCARLECVLDKRNESKRMCAREMRARECVLDKRNESKRMCARQEK